MNRVILIAAIIICAFFSIAQPRSPQAMTDSSINQVPAKQEGVYVRSLDISIRANEHSATTTLEMEIFNPENRMMDGTVEFSLHEGQVVSAFMLDIGEKMRQGVIVEKKKARKTYETIVNRKVDPGLLELTAGNNYRLRVYPVPAGGSRMVSITIDQQMHLKNNEALYSLPLIFNNSIDNYKLLIETENAGFPPEVRPGFLENLHFTEGSLAYDQKQVVLNKAHSFAIPIDRRETKICVDGSSYFSARLPDPVRREQNMSLASLSVFWDVSASAKNRDISRELHFLQALFEKFQYKKLKLILFNNEIQDIKEYDQPFEKTNEIRDFIRSLSFDGATSLEVLNNEALMSEQNFIFSDGINNYSKSNFVIKRPLTTVLSSSIGDPNLLKYLANSSGGHFLDLASGEINAMLNNLSLSPFQYLGAHGKNAADLVAYRQNGFIVISGRIAGKSARVEIELSAQNKKEIEINTGNCGHAFLENGWRASKINYESLVNFQAEDKIKIAGNQLGIVTPYTSFIVLETLEDYIQFDILPPAEFMEAYNKNVIVQARKKEREKSKTNNKENQVSEDRMDDLAELMESRSHWWKKKFPVRPAKNNAVAGVNPPVIAAPNQPSDHAADSATSSVRRNFTASVTRTEEIRVVMQEAETSLDEVVVTGMQNRRSASVVGSAVSGRVAGLASSGSPGSSNDIVVRGMASINSKDKTDAEDFYVQDKVNKSVKSTGRDSFKYISKTGLYTAYLLQKENEDVANDPSFYMETAKQLFANGFRKEAKRVLSNLAEMELEEPELIRAMAYILESWKEYGIAIFLYEKLLGLRDDEPQSFRNLALAKNEIGEHQEAVDLYHKALAIEMEEKDDISSVMLNEMNAIIDRNMSVLNLEKIDRSLISSTPVDLRIVIEWNKDQTDIDVHVTEPGGVECNYKNPETINGGLLSEDITDGYGPEEYSIRKANRGRYKIHVNYYGDNYQRVQVPSFIKISIYKNFGRANQSVEIKSIMMEGKKGMIEVGEVVF